MFVRLQMSPTNNATSSVGPNVEFFVDDLEADWAFNKPFDFIYMRMLLGAIRDWPKLFSRAFE